MDDDGARRPWPELDVEAYVAILDLTSRYCHIMDTRDWERLDQVWTDDGVWDTSQAGLGVARGLEEIHRRAIEQPTGVTHHCLNPLVVSHDNDEVRAITKYLSVWHNGRMGSGEYHDLAVRTPGGWRLKNHTCIVLRALGFAFAQEFRPTLA